MRHVAIVLAVVLCSFLLNGQETKDNNLLIVEDDWNKEVFKFPIAFAPDLSYQGYEEAYFSPDWTNSDKDGFWTYAFVWKINMKQLLNREQLESDLKIYFDGLMGVDVSNPKTNNKKTNLEFIDDQNGQLRGKLVVVDRFNDFKKTTLNFTVEQRLCESTKFELVLFRFSPKPFKHTIWNTLNAIHFSENSCGD